MDSVEYSEWLAFDAIEPIGSRRDDYNAAMQCALHANMNRKVGAKAYEPLDFMPFMPQETEEEKQARMQKEFEAWARTYNANLKK